MLVGTPETVTKQIQRLYERTGVGNVLLMNHAGAMSSNDVRKSMCLFTDEVRPAVEHLGRTGRRMTRAGEWKTTKNLSARLSPAHSPDHRESRPNKR